MGLEVDNVAMFWFFWSLFGGWIIYNKIASVRRAKIRYLSVAVCVVLGWLLTCVSNVWFYCIPNMLIAVGYLFIGHQMREFAFLERDKYPVCIFVGAIILAVVTLFFGSVHMYQNEWKLGPIDILGTGCIGILYIIFFTWMRRHLNENFMVRVVNNIGFNTLWILCIHAFEEKVFPWYRLRYLFMEKEIFAVSVCFILRCMVIFAGLKFLEFSRKMIKRRKRRIRSSQIIIE